MLLYENDVSGNRKDQLKQSQFNNIVWNLETIFLLLPFVTQSQSSKLL